MGLTGEPEVLVEAALAVTHPARREPLTPEAAAAAEAPMGTTVAAALSL